MLYFLEFYHLNGIVNLKFLKFLFYLIMNRSVKIFFFHFQDYDNPILRIYLLVLRFLRDHKVSFKYLCMICVIKIFNCFVIV